MLRALRIPKSRERYVNYFPYKLKRNQLYSIEGQPCVFTSHGYGTRLNFEHAATGKPVEYLDDAGVVRPSTLR